MLQALKLPADIQQRAYHVFYSVLNYAYEILTTESMLTLPADLTFKVNHDGTELVRFLPKTFFLKLFDEFLSKSRIRTIKNPLPLNDGHRCLIFMSPVLPVFQTVVTVYRE